MIGGGHAHMVIADWMMEFVANVTNLVPLDIDFLTKYIRRLF